MKALQLATAGERLSVLCLGAHSDDIEIGAGATLLSLIERGVLLDVHWCVLSGAGEREKEARAFGCGLPEGGDEDAGRDYVVSGWLFSGAWGSDKIVVRSAQSRASIPTSSLLIIATTRTRTIARFAA